MVLAKVGARDHGGRVRPVDPGRDMGAIADLIEVAFGEELQRAEGNRLVADLRYMAVLGPLLTVVDRVTPLAAGYVWEQDGRLVGNVSIAPEDRARRRWFISNVAVHPEYQGRGIGRQLMEAALAGIRHQGGRQAVLQVRADNEHAQRLYRRLGFVRFDTLVELLRPGLYPTAARPALAVRRLRNSDWPALLNLAQATVPIEAQRVRKIQPQAFRPTLGRRLQDWFDNLVNGRSFLRWGLEEGGLLVAVVSVLVPGDGTPVRLDLSVRPGFRGPLEGPLADLGLVALRGYVPRPVAANISVSHPEALAALQERHFAAIRTLDQLVLEW